MSDKMVLESGVLPPNLQLYAAAAAHLTPRPPWVPLLQFPGAAAQLLGMHGAFSPLNRPRYSHGLTPGIRAPPGPSSEDSGSETHGKGTFFKIIVELYINLYLEKISSIQLIVMGWGNN